MVYECKICGAVLEFEKGERVTKCKYCQTMQTLPKEKNEGTVNLLNRANKLRLKCEFDKAQEVYEKIIEGGSNDSEAFWGLVLCKYGIEYVEDVTHERIPTCHRTQIEPVLTDMDYQSAIANADSKQKEIYEERAKAIDKVQKNILTIVNKEEPYDIFICYKETDESGKRTKDSVIANDIYYRLTQEGYKVFYAAITLEDKLGQEYEPYIYAALNSAKVMLVVGTKPEYFNAVWVKNEWARYLKLMGKDKTRLLISCYRDMDPYDLPKEFGHLQAQDMGKIGFIEDLIHGIKKVIKKEQHKKEVGTVQESTNVANLPKVNSFLKRAKTYLEDEMFQLAENEANKALAEFPECTDAYVIKLLVDLKLTSESFLTNQESFFDKNMNYIRAIRHAKGTRLEEVEGYNNAVYRKKYLSLEKRMAEAYTSNDFENIANDWKQIINYGDSAKKEQECIKRADIARKKEIRAQKRENISAMGKSILMVLGGLAGLVIAIGVFINELC